MTGRRKRTSTKNVSSIMGVHLGQMLRPIFTKFEFVFDWCVCAASLELLVMFSVRDVGFKKMPFLGAGSVFAFLK